MSKSTGDYRPDVDGLRAVAVGLVMIFHSGLGFSGGFIGVDVFFVISGYLITGIIQGQLAERRFSFSRFWSRRIRRIIPAATLMTTVVLVVGYAVLLPIDYVALAKSAIWQQAMAANVYFWLHTGYFSGPADLMPLLHTWSLAVEEQFYLIYPFVLVLLSRVSSSWRLGLLGGAACASFVLSEWGLHRSPSATFFLLPTRAWEMLLGGILSMVPRNVGLRSAGFTQAMSLLGIGCIVLPAAVYSADTLFPGLRALVPCVGAALLIHAGAIGRPWVNQILGSAPVVHVGQLSYSLYLWHWPIIVFLKHIGGSHPTTLAIVAAFALTYGISYLSWRFVETPFRTEGVLCAGATKVFASFVLVVVSLGLCGLILTNNGFPHRAPERALAFHAARNDQSFQHSVGYEKLCRNDVPAFGDPRGRYTCLIWGDSHAMSLVAGLDAACKQAEFAGLQATYFGTAPLLDFYMASGLGLNEKAVEQGRAVVDFAVRRKVDLVILAAYWARYEANPLLEDRLASTIDELVRHGMRVAIVLDFATQGEDVPLMLARMVFRGDSTGRCGVSAREYSIRNDAVNAMIRRAARDHAVVLDPSPFLTDESGIWRAEMDGISHYCDDDHLSTKGSLRLTPMFLQMLTGIHRLPEEAP